MNDMKKTILFLALVALPLLLAAQTQQGYVKTRGRMVNGQHVRGQGLQGAMVVVQGGNKVVTQSSNGAFSIAVPSKTFLVQSVQKKGYQLVDADATKKPYQLSSNPLYLVMETPEQQTQDRLDAERKLRRTLQRQLQEREDEIEAMQVSLAEKQRMLQQLYDDQKNNEKLIADMSKRFSTLDYDQMDEFYRRVSYFIENGELTRADSLLRTRGDIKAQVQDILHQKEAIQQQEEQLQQAKNVHQADIEEAGRRCYSYYESFLAQHQYDSAAFYIELRANLDTTNVEWQYKAGHVIDFYLEDFNKANIFYIRVLRHGLPNYQENKEWIWPTYSAISYYYYKIDDYEKSLEYQIKELLFHEKAYGKGHHFQIKCYISLGNIYEELRIFNKALDAYKKALELSEKKWGADSPDVAWVLAYIAKVYFEQGSSQKAFEICSRSLTILEQAYGTSYSYFGDMIWEKCLPIISTSSKAMKEYVFTATVVDGNTPANEQGMSGEFIVLEFGDWNIESKVSLFDKSEELRGKPKTITVMQGDIIRHHHFEDKIGVQLNLKKVGKEEKQRIISEYKKWKSNQ